jgi:hypothetical protein
MLKIVREAPMRLNHLRADLPRPLDEAVAGALTIDPRHRHPSAEAFADALIRGAASVGIARADARDVRDFLLPMVQAELDTRTNKVTRIRQGRGSLPPVSERALHVDQGPTVAVVPISRPPSSSRLRMDATISEELEPRDRTSATVFETSDRPPVVGSAHTRAVPRSSARLWLFATAVLLVGFFGAVTIMKLSSADPEPQPATEAQINQATRAPALPQAVPAQPIAPALGPASDDVPDAQLSDDEVLDPSKLPVESTDTVPKAHGGPRRKVVPGKPAIPAESLPSQPEPLGNPYKHKK